MICAYSENVFVQNGFGCLFYDPPNREIGV